MLNFDIKGSGTNWGSSHFVYELLRIYISQEVTETRQ